MAKDPYSDFTKSEMADLERVGFVKGNKHTIPENISPAIKSRLLHAMGEEPARQPGVAGGPDAQKEREARRDQLTEDVDNRDKGGKK